MIVFRSRLLRLIACSTGFFLFCFCQSTNLRAQNISGVINDYAQVLDIDTCMNQLLVSDTKAFSVGDRVMIIQMKGAQIDQSNTASFGTVTSYGNAGNYEFGNIAAIQGLSITLLDKIVRLYDAPKGQVQLIRVPHYNNVTINGQVTAPAWYGSFSPVGGVVVFEASGSVTLNSDIDVSGKGFRGGDKSMDSQLPFDSSYYMPISPTDNGIKGEGIAEYPGGFETGRGPLANGGGGGNNQNGGGGGGANSGTGGIGGDQTSLIKRFPNGGLGGRPINYGAVGNRVFFGGGGGGGHENDRLGTPGGNGGGIIIIRASSIIAGGGRLISDGATARDAGDDGAGGGGGGGTIVLDVDPIPAGITLSANGGNGGNTVADTLVPYCVAPGGGGSGGTVIVKGPSVPPTSVAGGKAGIIISTVPALACKGTNYGATDGTKGGGIWNNSITDETIPFTYPKVGTHLFTICGGDVVQFDLPGAHSIKWSPGTGLDNDAIGNPNASPASTTHYSVSYLDYRNCPFMDTVLVIVNPKPAPKIAGSLIVCSGQTFFYKIAQIPGVTYNWIVTGGSILTGQGTENAGVQWGNGTTGKIEVDVSSPTTSCNGKDSLAITIAPVLGDTLTGGGALCAGDTMTITAQPGFAQYLWSTGDTVQSIKVMTKGDYWVKTVSAGGCTTYSDTVTVVVNPMPVVTINASSPLMPDFGGTDTLSLSGTFPVIKWSTGETTDTIIVSDSGTYEVHIIDSNGCKGFAFIHLARDISPPEITMSLDTLSAAPCSHITFPLRIDTSKNMPPSGATDFVTTITFDETLLSPDDKSIQSSTKGRWRTLTLHGLRPNIQVDGVLPGISFSVGLGDTVVTPIKIETFIFTNGKPVKVTHYDGMFRLTGLCQQGGTRLFSEFDTLMLGQNAPNPAHSYTTIKYSLFEDGNTRLWVADVLGRKVMAVFDDILKAGSYSVQLNTSALTSGNYFYILQTPTAVLRKMMRIDK